MAKTGITFNIQQRLAQITKNKELLDGRYLNKSTNENFIEMVKHLYPNQADRAKLLNPGSYIGNIIGDKIKNFVGDPVMDSQFDIDFDIVTESILTRGEILFKYISPSEVGGKWTISAVKPETYWQDGGKEKIAKLYPVYEDTDSYGNNPTYYLFVQTYDGRRLTNELFRVNNPEFLQEGEPVDLGKVYEVSKLPKVQVIENMPRLVETFTIADIPMIETVRSLMYSIDRKLAEAEKNFNDYTEQFKLFQNIEIPQYAYTKSANGGMRINWDSLGKLVRSQDDFGSADIKIIRNQNDLLDKALDRVDNQIRQISAITDIPLEFFGFDTVRDSGSGKEVGNSNLFKRIQKYRDKIEKTLNKCFDFIDSFSSNKIDRAITWPQIIRMSENDVLNKQVIMVQNNLTSLKRAIMASHNVSAETANEIIEEIKEDQSNNLLVSLKESNQSADALAKTNNVLK